MNKLDTLLALVLFGLSCSPSLKFIYKQQDSLGYRIYTQDFTYRDEIENFKITVDQLLVTMSENGSKFVPILSTNDKVNPTYLLDISIDSIKVISLTNQIKIFEMRDTILELAKLENKYVKQANQYAYKSTGTRATESIVGTAILNAIGLPFGVGFIYIAGNSKGNQIKPSTDLNFHLQELILQPQMSFTAKLTSTKNDSTIFMKHIECKVAIDSITNTSTQFNKLMRDIFPNLISSNCPFFEEYK